MKSSKLMRVVLGMAAITGTLVLAQDARGGDAPTFSELPVGRITTPPSKKVYSVSAQESVPGFFLVSPPHNSTLPPLQRRLSITTDARLAAALKSGNGFSPSEHITSGCLSQMQLSPFEDGEKEREWDENQSLDADAYPKNADNPMSGVVAIHSERIVEQDGAVTLESVDAWVDPATRGARLISKASLPLKLVRAPAFGMKVYAGRDERPDGRRFVQFVIVRPQTSQTARTTQMWSMRQDGAMAHASGCGHLRVALPIGGDGDTATIITTVELPTLDANGKEVKAGPPRLHLPRSESRSRRSARCPSASGPSRTMRTARRRASSGRGSCTSRSASVRRHARRSRSSPPAHRGADASKSSASSSATLRSDRLRRSRAHAIVRAPAPTREELRIPRLAELCAAVHASKRDVMGAWRHAEHAQHDPAPGCELGLLLDCGIPDPVAAMTGSIAHAWTSAPTVPCPDR